MLRIAAPWVVPVASPPIRDSAVLLDDAGRVVFVDADDSVPHPPGVREERFEPGIVIPGLINTHTHLELTGLGGAGAPGDFPAWIGRIRELKRARSAEEYRTAAQHGLRAAWRAGVTTVADTGDSGAVIEALAELGGRGVVYHEVFGPHPDQVGASLAELARAVDRLRGFTSERVRLGVSPHAPYTVSGPLYRGVAQFAERHDLPLAVHLAESRAESRLIADGTGPFADAWRARGIPLPHDVRHLDRVLAVRTPVRWLLAHGILGPATLCIHLVQADAADVAIVAGSGATVAHCPLSNAAHGHGEAPLAELLARGVPVGLGTDSAASVPCLDLFAEARAARGLAGLDAQAAVRLLSADAAMAIGFSDIGVLAPGAWGDLAVLGRDAGAGGVEEAVVAAAPEEVVATYVAGRQVWRGA